MADSLYEQGKEFADALTDTVKISGATTQLSDPSDAFLSGCYFGAVQGYTKGVNKMLADAIEHLPDIFNEIAGSNFDMSIDWPERYKEMLLEKCFNIEQTK